MNSNTEVLNSNTQVIDKYSDQHVFTVFKPTQGQNIAFAPSFTIFFCKIPVVKAIKVTNVTDNY